MRGHPETGASPSRGARWIDCNVVSIATKRGDTGTTGLLYGGRVRKDSARIACNGAVDEAQAFLGLARAEIARSGAAGPGRYSTRQLGELLVAIERDLWVLMAEVATTPAKRDRLSPGASLVEAAMLARIEERVEELESAGVMPAEFVVPGGSPASAALDVARTSVRRAEREAVRLNMASESLVVPYLNRLSDLCWLLARAVETEHVTARVPAKKRSGKQSGKKKTPERKK